MTETEETIIYDAMRAIQKHAQAFADVANTDAGRELRDAYKDGIYAPCIKLQVALGQEALERGRARHEELDRKAAEYFAQTHISLSNQQPKSEP